MNALAAATPIEAQRLSEDGQDAIDESARIMEAYVAAVDMVKELEEFDEPSDAIIATIGAVRRRYPGNTIAELEIFGRQRLKNRINYSGSSDLMVSGLGYLALECTAEVYLDEKRWTSVLYETKRVFDEGREVVHQLLLDQDVRDAVTNAGESTRSAFAKFILMQRRGIDTKETFREILSLYANLFEDALAPAWALLLLSSGGSTRRFSALVSDSNKVIDRVIANSSLRVFTDGVRKELRNAAQHGNSYKVRDGYVDVALNSFRGRVTFDEFGDNAMALIEGISAIYLILAAEIAEAGISLPESLGLFEPQSGQLLEFLLSEHGVGFVDLVTTTTSAEVFITELPEDITLTQILAAVSVLLGAFEHLAVSASMADGTHRSLRAATKDLPLVTATPEDPVLGTIRGIMRFEYNGQPLRTQGSVRSAAAFIALRALTQTGIQEIRTLREIRSDAIGIDDLQCIELINLAIRLVREESDPPVEFRQLLARWMDTEILRLP